MLAQGTILQNRYQVIRLLGQGGMGAVYQARAVHLGKFVALKENIGGDARQFQQEAVLLANLAHPSLPRVIDHFVELNGAQYLVMDLVEGEDLESVLQRQGASPETQALAWFDQILDAVAYLHSRGVIHRDIKPANIKIITTGQAVLVDFGIAKVFQPGQFTMTGAKAVSPGFAAPEQYRGGTDQRSDIYSLGATLYALLTGSAPPDAQALERRTATLTPPRILSPTMSMQSEQAILRAMELDTTRRWQTASEFRAALMPRPSIVRMPTRSAQPLAPTVAPSRVHPASAPPLWAWAVGGAGVMLVAALVLFGLAKSFGGTATPIFTPPSPQFTAVLPTLRPPTFAPPSPQFTAVLPTLPPPTFATTGGGTIKIVSSYPLTGGDSDAGVGMANAAKQAITKHGFKSGNLKLTYDSWDDASAARGAWDPGVETSNANKAAADKSILVYLGTYNSGAAKLSIPILDASGPLVMISGANTYPGLTKKAGAAPDEPDKYYPAGTRNYARTCPADDIQGKVAAHWAKQVGSKSVYILDDQQLYGKGIADVFEAEAKATGISVLGHEGADTKATDYSALATKIANLKPDAVYYGAVASSHPGLILKALHSAGWTGQFMGPDGLAQASFIKEAGADSEGAFITFGGLPPEEIANASPEGKAWYDDYVKTFGIKPDPYATYNYEAMLVALKAVDACVAKNDVSRKCVRDSVFATKDFKGILGTTWSFDANGDTTLTTMSKNIVTNGNFQFIGLIE